MKSLSHYFNCPEMAEIWSKENQHKTYSLVENYATEALISLGQMEKEDDPESGEEEEETPEEELKPHYPFDLLKNPGTPKNYTHPGLLTSNLLDTTLSLLMKQSSLVLLKDMEKLQIILKEKAFEHKASYMLSRLHGQTTPVITFGLKMANWYKIVERGYQRLVHAQETIGFGTLSGLTGTFSHLSPHVEENVCRKLELKPSPSAYQFLDRDRHAEFLTALALIAQSIKQFAEELYQLQRAEVQEIKENSSHTDFSLISDSSLIYERLKSLTSTVFENASSFLSNSNWYERTLGSTQTENHLIANSCILLDYILQSFIHLLDELVIDNERMLSNIEQTNGFVFIYDLVALLMEKKHSSRQAQSILKPFIAHCRTEKLNLIEFLSKDKEFQEYISHEELEKRLNLEEYLNHVDFIFNRVFTNE